MIDTRLSAIKRLNNFYCIFLGATISWWIVFTKCPTSNFQFLFGFFFENFLGDVLCYLKLCKCFSEACCLGGFDECLLDFLDWFCLLNWTKLLIEENLRKWNGYEGVSNKKVVGWNIFFLRKRVKWMWFHPSKVKFHWQTSPNSEIVVLSLLINWNHNICGNQTLKYWHFKFSKSPNSQQKNCHKDNSLSHSFCSLKNTKPIARQFVNFFTMNHKHFSFHGWESTKKSFSLILKRLSNNTKIIWFLFLFIWIEVFGKSVNGVFGCALLWTTKEFFFYSIFCVRIVVYL